MKIVLKILLVSAVCMLVLACKKKPDPELDFKRGKYEQAFALWIQQAQQSTQAQYYLGIHYFFGLGTQRDYNKALAWYEKAAKQGHVEAQRSYGDMHYNGHGIQKDFYQSFIWYFAASQQGSQSAKARLELLSSENKLTPNQQMHAKIEANNYIADPAKRFMSHDTYVDDKKSLIH